MSDDLATMAAGLASRAGSNEQIDVMVGRSTSTSIRVFEGEVEAFTSARTAGVGVRVIVDGQVGFAHAGSLDAEVLDDVLREARENVPFAERDEFVGLAEPDGVEPIDHEHWNERILGLAPEQKIEVALELERQARSLDDRVTSVRTAGWSDGAGEIAYATSTGVVRFDRGTSCSIGVQPLARADGETQIGYANDASRDPDAIDVERVAKEAVERATRLLGSVKPPSARLSIVLDPKLVGALVGIVSGMLDGESVIKGRSPFADRVGDAVASPLLTLVDDPTQSDSLGSDSWDGEGLACRRNGLIAAGVLGGFLQNSWTARRSGTTSTGSAVRGPRSLPGVGARVLVLEPGTRSFEELIGSIDLGLYVNSFAGLHSGVNPVSGDFSVGADGLMIRNGSLAEPVREVTIASTIQRMLLDIVEVGGDAEWLPSGDYLASLVIGDVSMAGV